jgi:transcriptional regulator with XRE-family HTH domain
MSIQVITTMSSGLGAFLRRELDGRGWTQRQASEQLEIPFTTLNNLLHGRNEPDLKTLRKLADGLKISIVRLLEIAGFLDPRETPGAGDMPAPIRRLTDEDRALIDSMSVEELEQLLDFVRAQRRRLRP